MAPRPFVIALTVAAALGATACSGDGRENIPTAPQALPGPLGSPWGWRTDHAFSHAPVELAEIASVLPLGSLTDESALPSADALVRPSRDGAAVRAMAGGAVIETDTARGCLTVQSGAGLATRYCGLRRDQAIDVGATVQGGQYLGRFDAVLAPTGLRIRVLDHRVNRTGWIRPERYGNLRHASFFAGYLPDTLRSHVFALVERASPDLEGRIDYDQRNRLVGSWFDRPAAPSATSAMASSASSAPFPASDLSVELAPHALTLAYDARRPGQTRIAVGAALFGALGLQGTYGVAWENADPGAVALETGAVRYTLFRIDDVDRADAVGTLLVQLLDDTTVRVEAVSPNHAGNAGFASRASTLLR